MPAVGKAIPVLWPIMLAAMNLVLSQAASSNCENPPLDISIVIDQTKSVGAQNYDAMLDSVMALISKYDVGQDKTHFSIVTYAGEAEVRVSFDNPKYHSKEALNQLIEEMKNRDKLGSPTRTDKALKLVGDEVFNEKNGDRPESPNVMIIFTDGGTHKTSEPYSAVLPTLEKKGVQRVAVGIGKDIKQEELITIAGDEKRVVNAKNFEDLNNQLDNIREATCNIDGGYTEWSEWSECTATCGGGTRHHSRTCTNPSPKNKGKTCEEQDLGPAKESEECNTQECPVPGGYTDWSEWGECSVTCGGGVQTRKRTCTNPPPSGGGPTCVEQKLGPAEEQKKCNSQDCGEDGNWSPWGSPGPCDKTCGGGTQMRKRTCTNPPPSGDGEDCKGSSTKKEPCNTQPCPTPEPPPPKPCREHLDIGVIVDSSNSISPGDYNIARDYLVRLAQRLEVSEAGTHMAILLYSWEAHLWHRFTEPQNIAALTDKAKTLPHIRGGTRTDRALELAAQEFFGWDNSGDRPDKPNVLLVLTDGDTNEGSKPFSQVIPPLNEADVRRIAVGIGRGIDISELRQIASSNDDVLYVNGYQQLIPKLEFIMNMACRDQYPGDCGSWGSFGSCSKTCSGGAQVRTRSCPPNSLHLRKQRKHCNTNLCPGQEPCVDKEGDCAVRAAAGKCWKDSTVPYTPYKMIYVGRKFLMWKTCPKSCRRCNVDTSCQDNDPYICPWWSVAGKNWRKCRYSWKQGFATYTLSDLCKKSCGKCSSGGGGGEEEECQDSRDVSYCQPKVRWPGCRYSYVKVACKKSCGQCSGGGGGECQDSDADYCRSKVRWPGCRNYYVRAKCKRSCGVCNGGSGGGGGWGRR